MKILYDCGSNMGQGYEKLNAKFNFDYVMMHDSNINCIRKLHEKYGDRDDIDIFHLGIAGTPGNRPVTHVYHNNDTTNNIGEWTSGASHLLSDNYIKPDYIRPEDVRLDVETVSCMTLPEIMENIKTGIPEAAYDKNFNVLKLDIEGCEFEVLDNLIATGYIKHFKVIAVEWHEHLMKVQPKNNRYYYLKYFHDNNILFLPWD